MMTMAKIISDVENSCFDWSDGSSAVLRDLCSKSIVSGGMTSTKNRDHSANSTGKNWKVDRMDIRVSRGVFRYSILRVQADLAISVLSLASSLDLAFLMPLKRMIDSAAALPGTGGLESPESRPNRSCWTTREMMRWSPLLFCEACFCNNKQCDIYALLLLLYHASGISRLRSRECMDSHNSYTEGVSKPLPAVTRKQRHSVARQTSRGRRGTGRSDPPA